MPEILVQIAPGQPAQSDTIAQGPFAAVHSHGYALTPIHEGQDDPALSRWFRVSVDADKTDAVLKALRADPGVSAAYVKPQAEPP